MKHILFVLLILGALTNTTTAQEKKQDTDSLAKLETDSLAKQKTDSAAAQKKTKDEAKAKPKTKTAAPAVVAAVPVVAASSISKDSLKTSQVIDSLNAQLKLYKGFYAYISGKFFPEKYKNIPIEKAIPLADSLRDARDNTFKGLESMSKGRMDSLSAALKTAEVLRIENQTFKTLLASLIGNKVYPQSEAELKGSWQVFVNPLKVTGTGQVSAIVSLERMVLIDSLAKQTIDQIVFLEEDLADIYFLGGKKTKCFYKVIGFSRDKTYSISLKKSDEIDIMLFVTAVPRGLQVSYKLGKNPNYFMFGYMRR